MACAGMSAPRYATSVSVTSKASAHHAKQAISYAGRYCAGASIDAAAWRTLKRASFRAHERVPAKALLFPRDLGNLCRARDEEWKTRRVQHPIGDTAHHPAAQPATPMRRHRDQVAWRPVYGAQSAFFLI
jgi:hypothetical protein